MDLQIKSRGSYQGRLFSGAVRPNEELEGAGWRARAPAPHDLTPAYAPPLKAPPADPAQSDSSYRPRRPSSTPGHRSSRNKFRTYPKSPRPWRRVARLRSNLFAGDLW